jgi:hypothetical protein
MVVVSVAPVHGQQLGVQGCLLVRQQYYRWQRPVPKYPEYRLGMTGLQADVSNAASTSDNTQAAMVPAH